MKKQAGVNTNKIYEFIVAVGISAVFAGITGALVSYLSGLQLPNGSLHKITFWQAAGGYFLIAIITGVLAKKNKKT